jgi:hypothetical protein
MTPCRRRLSLVDMGDGLCMWLSIFPVGLHILMMVSGQLVAAGLHAALVRMGCQKYICPTLLCCTVHSMLCGDPKEDALTGTLVDQP